MRSFLVIKYLFKWIIQSVSKVLSSYTCFVTVIERSISWIKGSQTLFYVCTLCQISTWDSVSNILGAELKMLTLYTSLTFQRIAKNCAHLFCGWVFTFRIDWLRSCRLTTAQSLRRTLRPRPLYCGSTYVDYF